MLNAIRKRLPRGAAILGVVTLANVLLGFGREAVTAFYFGTSMALDTFLVALSLPRLLTNQAGSITASVLLPVYMEHRAAGRTPEARAVIGRWFRFTAVVFAPLAIAFVFFGEWVVSLLAPGLDAAPRAQAAAWLVALVPFLALGVSSGVFKVVLDAQRWFGTTAAMPGWISLGGALGCFILGPSLGVAALLIGLTAGALVSLTMQWVLVRRIDPRWIETAVPAALPYGAAGVMLLNSVAHQLHPLVDRAFASALPAGSIASLNYANTLISVPLTLVASTLATSLFPALIEKFTRGEAKQGQRLALRWMGILALISVIPTVVLYVWGEPLTALVLERGRFDHESTTKTAAILGVLALQIPASSCIVVSTRLLLAQRLTRAVAIVAFLSIGLKIIANALLVERLGLVGLAWGSVLVTTLALGLQVALSLSPWARRVLGGGVASSKPREVD